MLKWASLILYQFYLWLSLKLLNRRWQLTFFVNWFSQHHEIGSKLPLLLWMKKQVWQLTTHPVNKRGGWNSNSWFKMQCFGLCNPDTSWVWLFRWWGAPLGHSKPPTVTLSITVKAPVVLALSYLAGRQNAPLPIAFSICWPPIPPPLLAISSGKALFS